MPASLSVKERKGVVTSFNVDVFVTSALMILSVYKVDIVPTAIMQGIRCAAIAILLLLHFKAICVFPHKVALFAFPIAMSISSLCAGCSYQNVVFASVQGLNIISLFISCYDIARKYGLFQLFDSVFWLLFALSLLNDLTVFATHFNNSSSQYLMGNKFTVGDIHTLLLGLYAALLSVRRGYLRYNRGIYVALVFESAIVLVKASAMTALLCLLLSVALTLFLTNRVAHKLSEGLVITIVIVAANVIYFGTGMLLDIPAVQFFIQDVLGRSLTMTGRTPIYDCLELLINEKPVFGWGYGNTAVMALVGYGNAQNGIAELMVNYGAFGVLAFFVTVIGLFPCVKKFRSHNPRLVAIIYGTILASLVEISFGLVFFFALSLIFAGSVFPLRDDLNNI